MKKVVVASLLLLAPLCQASDYRGLELVNSDAWNVIKDLALESIWDFKMKHKVGGSGEHELSLENCDITDWDDDIIRECIEIKTRNSRDKCIYRLSLANNHLTTFPFTLLLASLTELNLTENQIKTLPEYPEPYPNCRPILSPFFMLLKLYLDDNEIEALPSELYLPSLRILSLRNNKIEHINPEQLEQLPQLSTLDIAKNHLDQKNIAELETKMRNINNERKHPPMLTVDCSEQKIHTRNVKGS